MLSYFTIIGTIHLIMLTYKDIKHKMLVDDRHNWFMSGLAISLLSHINRNIWYLLGLTLIVLIFNYTYKKLKVFGEADTNSITWIFIGGGYYRGGVI